MGSNFKISAVSDNEKVCRMAVGVAIDEIRRIENLISSWDDESETSRINKNAGVKPVAVDRELLNLIKRSKKISEMSDGAFDISFASMDKIWTFDKTERELPGKEEVKKARSLINWENVILDEEKRTVYLKEKGMKIGFGGIGKGYAADMASKKNEGDQRL